MRGEVAPARSRSTARSLRPHGRDDDGVDEPACEQPPQRVGHRDSATSRSPARGIERRSQRSPGPAPARAMADTVTTGGRTGSAPGAAARRPPPPGCGPSRRRAGARRARCRSSSVSSASSSVHQRQAVMPSSSCGDGIAAGDLEQEEVAVLVDAAAAEPEVPVDDPDRPVQPDRRARSPPRFPGAPPRPASPRPRGGPWGIPSCRRSRGSGGTARRRPCSRRKTMPPALTSRSARSLRHPRTPRS